MNKSSVHAAEADSDLILTVDRLTSVYTQTHTHQPTHAEQWTKCS